MFEQSHCFLNIGGSSFEVGNRSVKERTMLFKKERTMKKKVSNLSKTLPRYEFAGALDLDTSF